MQESKYGSFDLDREMLSLIGAEFSPDLIARRYSEAIGDNPTTSAVEIGLKIFSEFGREWAKRTLDLGEKYSDRTYEVLKETAAKTGRLVFPLFPQRFIEIAYLATQKISILPIVENNAQRFVYRVENCEIYRAVDKHCPTGTAKLLTCEEGCLTLCRTILSNLNIKDVDLLLTERTSEVGHCIFNVSQRSKR